MAEGVQIATANKDIGQIATMLKEIETRHRIGGLGTLFAGLRIAGEEDKSRAAFPVAHVRDRLLSEGALAGLNAEARGVVYLMVETGLRISEAVNLTAGTIHLNAPVPYISVEPDGRRMKTRQSEREIPLVGSALLAMRAHPAGFPRYRDKAATLSATVNKHLRERGLLPTEEHSLYSLRHTFEDRLTAVEAPEKLIAALMGHKYARPRYGAGPSLEQKRQWLDAIALAPPSRV